MLQDSPLESLTKLFPPWIQLLGWFAVGVYFIVRYVRKGKRAEDAERLSDIEKSVAPYRELADTADRRLSHCREELMEEREAREEAETEVKTLRAHLRDTAQARDELQEKVMRIQGRQDDTERRLDALERGRRHARPDSGGR